jgi:hypothetical protein
MFAVVASQFPAGPLAVILLVCAGLGALFLGRPSWRRRRSNQR